MEILTSSCTLVSSWAAMTFSARPSTFFSTVSSSSRTSDRSYFRRVRVRGSKFRCEIVTPSELNDLNELDEAFRDIKYIYVCSLSPAFFFRKASNLAFRCSALSARDINLKHVTSTVNAFYFLATIIQVTIKRKTSRYSGDFSGRLSSF